MVIVDIRKNIKHTLKTFDSGHFFQSIHNFGCFLWVSRLIFHFGMI